MSKATWMPQFFSMNRNSVRRGVAAISSVALLAFLAVAAIPGAHDPGPRAGAAGAGGPFPTLNAEERAAFEEALEIFTEVNSVSGTIPGEDGSGLGPAFNGNSCAMCHAQPAVGGSSPGLASPQNPVPNPQVALATLNGADNFVPSFITPDGPVREARFKTDDAVHNLYTIKGRSDAPGCNLRQPMFAQQLALRNVIFRIPTNIFGLGLVEGTPDANLIANLASRRLLKASFGIAGTFNTSDNDQTITRFGWKAQNKSLLMFAGEAYNVEQGVSNELFPSERSAIAGCVFGKSPEDATRIINPNNGSTVGTAVEMSADTVSFALFPRLSAPAAPAPLSASARNGANLFENTGCSLCHSSSLTTGASPLTGMSYVTYHPYSDFALHHMGSNLADGISQGHAGPDEFRTAPLWGVGQRLFFLHDGRTSDLLQAISAHSSQGSEANTVIRNFRGLNASQVQDILNFLRSL